MDANKIETNLAAITTTESTTPELMAELEPKLVLMNALRREAAQPYASNATHAALKAAQEDLENSLQVFAGIVGHRHAEWHTEESEYESAVRHGELSLKNAVEAVDVLAQRLERMERVCKTINDLDALNAASIVRAEFIAACRHVTACHEELRALSMA